MNWTLTLSKYVKICQSTGSIAHAGMRWYENIIEYQRIRLSRTSHGEWWWGRPRFIMIHIWSLYNSWGGLRSLLQSTSKTSKWRYPQGAARFVASGSQLCSAPRRHDFQPDFPGVQQGHFEPALLKPKSLSFYLSKLNFAWAHWSVCELPTIAVWGFLVLTGVVIVKLLQSQHLRQVW